MSPYDQAFLPGNRVLLYLEGPGPLPRELTGAVLGMNPVGLVVAADPGSLDEDAVHLSHIHDDGKLPPLFLSWNCVRAAFLLGDPKEKEPVSVPMPECMQSMESPRVRPEPQSRMTNAPTPTGRPRTRSTPTVNERYEALADWVPGDQPVPQVPVVRLPIATPEVTLSDAAIGSDFHSAFVAELNALRQSGKLYG